VRPNLPTTFFRLSLSSFGGRSVVASPLIADTGAAGDFNGDGKLDGAFISGTSLGVALGDGAGGFTVSYQTLAASGASVSAADIDGDGRLDLLVPVPSQMALVILKGDGAGGFTSASIPLNPADQVAIGDLNRDGRPDLASVHYPSQDVNVFLQTASGWSVAIPYTAGAAVRAVALADMDGDGLLDIATACDDGTVRVLRATAPGAFAAGALQNGPANPRAIAVADVDLDGAPDLVVSGSGGVSLFPRGVGPAIAVSEGGAPAVVADVDLDGRPDVVLAGGSITVAHNVAPRRCGPAFETPAWREGPDQLAALATGDLDRDGKLDVAYVSYDALHVELGRGDGTFRTKATYEGLGGATAIALGDITGDGVLDVAIVRESQGDLYVMQGYLDGSFGSGGSVSQPGVPVGVSVAGMPTSVAIADLDGDGLGDLAVTCREAADVKTLMSRGDLTFDAAVSRPAFGAHDGISASDLNGDGRKDLFLRANGTEWQPLALLNDGSGGFVAQSLWTGNGYYEAHAAAAGDVDGDGAVEIVSVGSAYASGPGVVVWGLTSWGSYQREGGGRPAVVRETRHCRRSTPCANAMGSTDLRSVPPRSQATNALSCFSREDQPTGLRVITNGSTSVQVPHGKPTIMKDPRQQHEDHEEYGPGSETELVPRTAANPPQGCCEQ
jgi:hypothetical protein